jgi:N-acyl-D-aspartate/D-glutamate deacylase
MEYDLKIAGGTIVDGTGAERVRGDVGINKGKVVALGNVEGDASETIDAEGCVVSPGFVDIHTHYDAQILWDRMLSISPWHGVTTAVIGNCGFGVAPMREEHRETVMRTLEKVEGMAYEALSEGLGRDWPFITFPEYLDALEAAGSAINVAAYVGHTPIRLFVMGEDATEREATEAEVEEMKELVREAMSVGAIGFATSQAATHHGAGGKPVPSRLASFSEIDALVGAMAESGRGILQAAMGRTLFNDEFTDLATRHGVPITWTALLAGMTGKGRHRRYLDRAAEQHEAGLTIVPQVACRPIMFDFNFDEPYPFELWPMFRPTMTTDRAGRMALYRDPDFRAAFKVESAPDAKNANAGWASRTVISRHEPDPSIEERPLAEIAAQRGLDPVDLVLDLSLETGLQSRFRLAFLNHDEREVEELVTDPHTVVTLSDAGAHASQLCDACYSTHLLSHWVRDKRAMSLEAAVHALTQRPAELMGITDRGLLAVGRPADVVVFDPDAVGHSSLRRVQDFPGDAERLVSDAIGVEAVVVNGSVLRHQGEDRFGDGDELPGRVLRRGHA